MKNVALYCRESVDRSGRAENVADQEKWGREYAASKWAGVPVMVFTDNDLSAAKDDRRPGYEALRAAVQRGEVGHLWCVEQSRLERREVEWFILAAELSGAGIDELHTNRDGVVRVRDEVAGIKAVLNAAEVRKLTRRVNDRLDAIAEQGRPPGSRPFGYVHAVKPDGAPTYEVVPEQAEAIRLAAGKVLAGWSLGHVADELRERGLHGAHRVKIRNGKGEVLLEDGRYVDPKHIKEGRYADPKHVKDGVAVTRPTELTAETVRRMLTSPAVAGHRVHRGTDHGPGSGNWPPILDEDTWNAVRDRLGAARTVTRSDGGAYVIGPAHMGPAGRRYTLTGGLAVCGRCGAPLKGQVLKAAKGKPYLQCYKKGCGLAIMCTETEEHVADRLFEELGKPAFLSRLAADEAAPRREEITKALRAVDARRRELAAMWGAEQLTSEEWASARAAQDDRMAALQRELAALAPPPPRVDAAEARAAYPFMTLDEKRELLRLFIERVTIKPAVPGLRRFDGNRVVVKFIER